MKGPFLLNDEKIEEIPIQKEIISVPWENDNFSLNLDSTFSPSHIIKKKLTKQCVPPRTSSPLRNQWRISTARLETMRASKWMDESQSSIDHPEEEEEDQDQPPKKKSFKLSSKDKNKPDLFPYSNSSKSFHCSSSIREESIKSPSPSPSKSRIEHVSPLLNSPVLQFDDIPSILQESRISVESWKIRYNNEKQYHPNIRTNLPSSVSSLASSSGNFRSMTGPKSADNLAIYSSTDSSIYGGSDIMERPYSHYFNPTFNHSTKKRSTSVIKKLLDNIKHRFK